VKPSGPDALGSRERITQRQSNAALVSTSALKLSALGLKRWEQGRAQVQQTPACGLSPARA